MTAINADLPSDRARARGRSVALFTLAALARRAGQHRRRAACQGSRPRTLTASGGDVGQPRYRQGGGRTLVHPGDDIAQGPAPGVSPAQDPFLAGGRRIWRRDGSRDAGGHHRGDRRRHQGRARPRGPRRASADRWLGAGRGLGADPRPQFASWPGIFPTTTATTIAGLVIHEARAIPESGQVFTFHRFRFEVQRKLRNRIVSLRIVPAREGAP